MAYEELGAYREPPLRREFLERDYGGLTLSLTKSQHEVLSEILRLSEEARDSNSVIPLYVSADTGAGKSHLSLVAAAAVARQLSLGLSKLHSVYVAPTKFLASQMGERSSDLYRGMRDALGDVEVIEIRGDMDREDKARSVERAFSKLEEGMRLVLTNPQMLASLSVRRSTSFGIGDRITPFNLISGLAEVDLYIIDEPHFYTGKSFVRLLTLLLEIGRWKISAPLSGPTFLLFISATMDPLSIEGALHSLEDLFGIGVLDRSVPLWRRNLELVDREAGEKLISLGRSDFDGLVELVNEIEVPRVIYADSVNMLVSLQERVKGESVILHSQMPKKMWDRYLERVDEADTILMTSVGEVGIELESLDVHPASMVSVNSLSVMKVVQRLGRLARRYGSHGTFFNVDLPWARREISSAFSNGLTLEDGRENLPSFLEVAKNNRADFFSSYISPCADKEFHEKLMAIGRGEKRFEVPKIYLSSTIRVRSASDDGEELSLPLMKVASTVVAISTQHELKVWYSDLLESLVYEVRGRSGSRPNPVVRVRTGNGRYDVAWGSARLPQWLLSIGVVRVYARWREKFEIQLPLLDNYRREFISPAIYFVFADRRFGRGFRWSDEFSSLEMNLQPASQDLDFIVPEGESDRVVAYERAPDGKYGMGAVERALEIISGKELNRPCG